MNSRSIRLRLLGLATLWVGVSLAATAVILHTIFVASVERDIVEDLSANLNRLIALMDVEPPDINFAASLPDPRYETPLGGRYWQVQGNWPNGLARSRSLWDMIIPLEGLNDGLHHLDGSSEEHFIFLVRTIWVKDQSIRVAVGEDHTAVHSTGAQFSGGVTILLALLGALMLAFGWLLIHFGLLPLDRLRSAIDDIRQGRRSRLEPHLAVEVQPLVNEINALLGEREETLEKARQRASDLAHGLKTPLAALQGVTHQLREQGQSAEADAIDDVVMEASKHIDYHLRLSVLRARRGSQRESVSITNAVVRTIAVLKKTGRGEHLFWMAELVENVQVNVHRQDLLELIGVILENAAKWAKERVVVRASCQSEYAHLQIADDGPGIDDSLLAEIGQRGRRLDESKPGSGLGLAIASEIVAQNGGRLSFARASEGGLEVLIILPLAR
ncbi:signal transduction histidine kinase [Devosia subaequoris]|uniref:histidine kinase n=1 Tax=Devosia subaequoris TaxID=395930 RepID=A0A7W6IKH4_9HYPH|nr:HAMP domain-containing sensor histidine kinase [Devosia subaequoris]MBB4051318.1 signal transduction histidine kinase [Devosia subaequoris]MCP1208917.1 HAMP domain-containing histidine kinase [Devosia subaequoris]